MGNLNEERLRKFREMGIPQPMAPVDPASVQLPVKNTEFAKKLAAIKSGAIKETVDVFLEREGATKAFVALPTPTKGKNKQKEQITETIKTPSVSGPSFDAYEKALYGDSTPSSSSYERASAPARGYSSDVDSEGDGKDFLDNIRARLAEKAARAGQNPGQRLLTENQNKSESIPAGYKLINENELKETVTAISTQLIKKFMSEFLTSEPGLIKESDKIKKAEIIKEDIVKIDGKFFKLTPVTVKKK
jgi:hypothetical protein